MTWFEFGYQCNIIIVPSFFLEVVAYLLYFFTSPDLIQNFSVKSMEFSFLACMIAFEQCNVLNKRTVSQKKGKIYTFGYLE
jgi:hypothetical protein